MSNFPFAPRYGHRTLIVVNTKTRQIVATRDENMNCSSVAKITKPLYELLIGGDHICYYAHRPDQIRVPAMINGRYFAKPTGWVPKEKKSLQSATV
jgi:hypothetical protein